MAVHDLITFFVTLFALTNPFGNLAIFVGLVEGRSVSEQRAIAFKTGVAVAIILVIVTLFGKNILDFLVFLSVPLRLRAA
nr:MarC family protein [Piscirickettsia litoralis]